MKIPFRLKKNSTSNLNSEKLDNSEINLIYQPNSRSFNKASLNSLSEISELRLRNVNRVLIGNLNINSIRNKFDQLKDTVLKYIDILILTETKLDETFLISQFLMDVFSKPYRFDRNKQRGGVMVYIRETIPSKILEKHSCPNNTECLFIELNFRKCKWLLCGTYHLPSQNDEYYCNYLDKALDTYSNYEKVLLIGDFTTERTEHYIESFLYEHEFSNLVKEKTCFKNMQNPTCTDLLLTNNSYAVQQTTTVCSGLSDCHKLVSSVLKRQITYRDYERFDSLKFNNELKNVLTIENIDNCIKFDGKFLEVLDKHAPFKRKLLTANHASYVSTCLRKVIMRRSYLEKVYFKNRTENSLRAFKKLKKLF